MVHETFCRSERKVNLHDFLFLRAPLAFPDRNAGDADQSFAGDRGARRPDAHAAAAGARPAAGRQGTHRPHADAAPHATSRPRAALPQGPVHHPGRVQVSPHRMNFKGDTNF